MHSGRIRTNPSAVPTKPQVRKPANLTWCYVSPQRIRTGVLALPHEQTWTELEDLNVQRLARVLELGGCVGFIGLGTSVPLGYPEWGGLLPDLSKTVPKPENLAQYDVLRKLARSEGRPLEVPQALEIAEYLLGQDNHSGRRTLTNQLILEFSAEQTTPRKAIKDSQYPRQYSREAQEHPPLERLLEFPIRRFVTTNYDMEIEEEICKRLGLEKTEVPSFSLIKDATKGVVDFAVASGKKDAYQVFHCHGLIPTHRLGKGAEGTDAPILTDLILTDSDYKHWYLSDKSTPLFFQRTLDILLQSNPLLFVGYSLSDVDLVRILRRLSTRHSQRRVASVLFGIIHSDVTSTDRKMAPGDALAAEYVNRGLQIKWGLNLFPYNFKEKPLTVKLKELRTLCSEARATWRCQARAANPETRSVCILPNDCKALSKTRDTLFTPRFLNEDAFIRDLDRAISGHSVVTLLGPADAGKYVKVSQFLRCRAQDPPLWTGCQKFETVVFSTHGSEDIYSYLKRLARATFSLLSPDEPLPVLRDDETIVTLLRQVMERRDGTQLLIVLTGLDHFLDYQTEFDAEGRVADWEPRNKLAKELVRLLDDWGQEERHHHILLTSRALPPDLSAPAPSRAFIQCAQKVPPLFTEGQLGLDAIEHRTLCWHLQQQQAALLIASAYVVGLEFPFGKALKGRLSQTFDARRIRLDRLVEDLSAHSSDRGLTVVAHVVRELDLYSDQGPAFEKLLRHLSCFKTPISMDVLMVCFELSKFSRIRQGEALKILLSLRLVEATAPLKHQGETVLYVIPPVVKRFCRSIVSGSAYTEKRSCGVHGMLSRGPFNEPDSSKTAQQLFARLIEVAFNSWKELANLRGGNLKEKRRQSQKARWFTRAVLEVLRSNFSCNSVSRWGNFSEYINMCSAALDLVKNLALAIHETWDPGGSPEYFSEAGAASAEEMVFLYNELGLAYYNEGAIQDALSIWALAFEWQKVIASQDHHQGLMYAASLNSHMAMAYMQMGQMEASGDCIAQAIAETGLVGNADLGVRLRGIVGRLNYFRGSLGSAGETFRQIVDSLERLGNRRAQSYFLRHWASLEIRLKRYSEAESHLRLSISIAASEGSRDNEAFARELLGRLYRDKAQYQDAIREFRAGLVLSRELGIARLEADASLGIARVQLSLGDAMAARDRATDALKIANESLLVLRQIKALIILGESTAELREVEAGTDLVRLAKEIAAESGFRLAEHDADQALANLRAKLPR